MLILLETSSDVITNQSKSRENNGVWKGEHRARMRGLRGETRHTDHSERMYCQVVSGATCQPVQISPRILWETRKGLSTPLALRVALPCALYSFLATAILLTVTHLLYTFFSHSVYTLFLSPSLSLQEQAPDVLDTPPISVPRGRRMAVSASVMTEEQATSYIKKVCEWW